MTTDFNQCFYLDGENDNASSMLKKCINGGVELDWPCSSKTNQQIQSRSLERPNGDNVLMGVEGFTNMGEKYVRLSDCPDGYKWSSSDKRCIQVCMNCKYNERAYGKSKEYNEYDQCFPNNGVYTGIDNQGFTQCTCGKNDQYCKDTFTTDGSMWLDGIAIMNIGDFTNVSKLAGY